jgi:CHAT domain-containing protein
MSRTSFYFFNLLFKAILFLTILHFHSLFGVAQNLDRNSLLQDETRAIELSTVWEFESIKRAIELFEQTADNWEKLNEPQRAAFCLNESAKLTQIASDNKKAFRNLERALKLADRNNLLEEKIISSSLLALLSIEKGVKEDSEKYSRQAISLSQKETSAKARGYSFFCAGMFEYYYGNLKDAVGFFEQANLHAQQTQDIFLISQVLSYVGFSYLREGNPYKAMDEMNLARELCERYNYQKGKSFSYSGLAFLSYFLNEKQKALDYFKKSESLFPADFEWMEKARIVNAIGKIYMDFGELEIAEVNFRKAIGNYEKANYPSGKITTLTNLAEIYVSKSDLIEAKRTYESATELALKIGDKFSLASIKEGLGSLAISEKNYDEAVKNYFEALRLYDESGVKMPQINTLLGNIYTVKNDFSKARKYYDSALKTNQETKNFLQLSENLFRLSKLNAQELRLEQAAEQIRQSVDLTETLYTDLLNSKLKRAFLSSTFERYEHFINLLMEMKNKTSNEKYVIEALQTAEKSRARMLLENLSLAEANFTKDADPETVRREKEIRILLNTKADKLTDLLSSKAEKAETDKISGEISELENELEDIKARIKQQSPVYSAIKNPAPFNVAEFQQNILDENTLLLEFSFGTNESYLWIVDKTQVASFVLPPREQIESSIQTLRGLLKERELKTDESIEDYQQRIGAAEIRYQSEAADLSRQLFGQAAGKLAGKRLIIVPDGALHYFPVAALPLPDSAGGEPILLTNETIYEPSAQTLMVLAKSRRAAAPVKNLLVFSDPIFTSDDVRFSAENKPVEKPATETAPTDKFRFAESLNNLPRLAASKHESETITATVGAANTENYSGFAATREKLLSLKTDDYKILHFATHGLTDEQRPELSGIVLSRFDEQGQKLNEFFRIQDIYGLNLNADLVVLSACATGVGKQLKGEGLMSLNNAFLQTGSKSVLASLWKVEDGATLELMKNFYGALADERLTPSEALRRAQIKLRENPHYKSPFYWAAFTVQGDFRSVPQISGGYGSWIYVLPILPLPLIGFYLYRRKIRMRA